MQSRGRMLTISALALELALVLGTPARAADPGWREDDMHDP
jgi:hypothetical protein